MREEDHASRMAERAESQEGNEREARDVSSSRACAISTARRRGPESAVTILSGQSDVTAKLGSGTAGIDARRRMKAESRADTIDWGDTT